MDIETIREPGGYADGPVFLRVQRAATRGSLRLPGYPPVVTGPLSGDHEHHYVEAENSHIAHVLHRWLRADGVPTAALAVIRVRG